MRRVAGGFLGATRIVKHNLEGRLQALDDSFNIQRQADSGPSKADMVFRAEGWTSSHCSMAHGGPLGKAGSVTGCGAHDHLSVSPLNFFLASVSFFIYSNSCFTELISSSMRPSP